MLPLLVLMFAKDNRCEGLKQVEIIETDNRGMTLYSGKKSPELLDYLLHRRSVMAQTMHEPAPSESELQKILEAGARVPDHGKLSPWYFIVFEGGQRDVVGKKVRDIYSAQNPNAKPEHLEIEGNRFSRAPLVIGVISRIRTGKVPMWEQALSAGAACQNIVLAANASGYAAQWLTEWYAFDQEFRVYLGLDGRDNVAGFIHIGTPSEIPSERPRPDLQNITTKWEEGGALNKGDMYNSPKFGMPAAGFNFSDMTE